ncbi:MAG: Type 1 glutamine amidotransferase-like domain-containing protein [Clostridiales bacterium]|jgi:dipeptidase E|nr:Type 1 glutamine amidotransferase-like domain-containing protein [Clostridiales bacterium]
MSKLFLTSYFSGVADLFPGFAGEDCSGKKVVFIPTASLPEKVTFYVNIDKKALQKLGMIIEDLEISTASKEEIEKSIANTDYIFVSGGNTFFLLQELKRKCADKTIIEHISNGKLYIGSSAGSIVLSKDIGYVKIMDSTNAAPDLNGDYSALSVVDFCVVPHLTNFPFKKVAEKIIKEFSDILDIRGISNNQVIIVDGERVETLTAKGKQK